MQYTDADDDSTAKKWEDSEKWEESGQKMGRKSENGKNNHKNGMNVA